MFSKTGDVLKTVITFSFQNFVLLSLPCFEVINYKARTHPRCREIKKRNDDIMFRASKETSMKMPELCLAGRGIVVQVDRKVHLKPEKTT